MSGQIESALVLQLTDAIKWGSALGPVDETGALTQVNPSASLDVTKYGRRDRELGYRDLINAAAVLKVSLEVETVFNSTPIRPKVEGLTTEVMPPTTSDLGRVNSQVVHVKNSSVPKDALDSDKDLAGRDALLYEVLARACQVFSDPPLTPNDPSGSSIPGVTAWSLAEARDAAVNINAALPVNTNTFKQPDQHLAGRDNELAAYVSRLCQILKNPFEFADRLYVQLTGPDERETEVFSLIRVYYEEGHTYLPDEEVYHKISWYRANQYTNEVPGESSDWTAIDNPTLRIFQSEPDLLGRNRFIYNTDLKTLQWISENLSVVHTPQVFALSIPGPLAGQTITTVPAIPEGKDAEFWRQKAGHITYEGTYCEFLAGYHDTTNVQTGVMQLDTTGFAGPDMLAFPMDTALLRDVKYRFTALVKPSQSVQIFGGYNTVGLTGTLNGVTFTGDYSPSPTTQGEPIKFTLTLPAGQWEMVLEYTDLQAATTGFGTRIRQNGKTILEDASPLMFQDVYGVKYPIGTLLNTNPILFQSNGGQSTFEIQWTYGNGLLHIRTLTFTCRDRKIGRYSMRVDVTMPYPLTNVSLVPNIGTLIPTVDCWGERDLYAVMPFEFTSTGNSTNPRVVLKYLPSDDQMPLQVRQVMIERVEYRRASPEFGGFLSWKQECLNRAHRAVSTAYQSYIANTTAEDMPDFTLDGTLWDKNSTEAWMTAIETYHPRLREIRGVTAVKDNRQYGVFLSGYVVYNGGTYTAGQKFWGTNVETFFSYGGVRLDQQGAFTLSYPGHIGKPALIPRGLYYDLHDIKQSSTTNHQSPVIGVCQPWMIEAGIYVAKPAFWVPETITSGLEVEGAPIDRYPDTLDYITGFREGERGDVVYTMVGAETLAPFDGVVRDVVIIGSAGTHFGTVSVAPYDGTLTTVVITGTGTQYGTLYVEPYDGVVLDVVYSVSAGTHEGTVSVAPYDGLLTTVVVDGGAYDEDGTFSMGFLSGAYV